MRKECHVGPTQRICDVVDTNSNYVYSQEYE